MITTNTSTHLKSNRTLLVGLVMVSLALGACGVRGDPQIPPPIWGDKEAPEQLVPPNSSS